jgi:hypothetical protein
MMRFLAVWCALFWLGPAWAAFDLDQLMADLASQSGGRARFVEIRHVALLDKPLQSSGEMLFVPPDRLEKRTLKPRVETLVLDRDTLSMERGNRRVRVDLASRPEALAFVDSIRSTLTGDRRALEQHYALSLEGDARQWTLSLLPKEPSIAGFLRGITITGSRHLVQRIEYRQTDGDRSEIHIDPIESP